MSRTPLTRPADAPDATDSHQPSDHGDDDLCHTAAAVLDGNWADDHMVPSRLLYPHQWSWDTAFICIGLVRLAPERAWRDLRSLFEAQWADGRVPHIVFDPDVAERDYFPGPAFWNAPAPPARPTHATTGIVQPPVHAVAAWEMYRHTGNSDELAWLYPRLVAQQQYLARRRDAGGAGLASIVHPWESGLDNSPSWDEALSAVPADPETLRRHRRCDLKNASVAHRPTDEDYARYISIAEAYRNNGYHDDDLVDRHPFVVECPTFNALTAAAEVALARIAEVVGAGPSHHRERAAQITRAMMDRLYDPSTGMFHALDVRGGKRSAAHCVSGLVPLILPDLPAEQVISLVAEASSPRFGLSDEMAGPLPSYDRTAADFDRFRYWRGPTWINMNWLLWRGLREHGHTSLASALRGTMLDLIRRSGCHEYFDPYTGDGIGAPAFSWTAALALDLLGDG